MTLADFTREDLCLPQLPGSDPTAVLCELSRALERAHFVPSSLALINVALDHYFLADSDTRGAVAYAIARLPSLPHTVFAVGRRQEALQWRPGGACVRLVFLIAGPSGEAFVNPAVLAAVHRVASDPGVLAALCAAPTPAAMAGALRQVEVNAPIDVPDPALAISFAS